MAGLSKSAITHYKGDIMINPKSILFYLIAIVAIVLASCTTSSCPEQDDQVVNEHRIKVSTATYRDYSLGKLPVESATATAGLMYFKAKDEAGCSHLSETETLLVLEVLHNNWKAIEAKEMLADAAVVNSFIEKSYHAQHALEMTHNWDL
jgi:hypothetical protein